jgi:CHAD domain-containing protein
MAAVAAFPVKRLREHAVALEAAITVGLAEPGEDAVHAIRRETRRVEAQIKLLERVELRPPRKQMERVLRRLKKVRRAAGRVRDLDVQQKLMKDLGRRHAPQDASALGGKLEEKRDLSAERLLKKIEKRQWKIASALENLMKTLEGRRDEKIGVSELLRAVEEEFRVSSARAEHKSDELEHLHGLRKAAKQARYQAESIEGSLAAKTVAARYEKLQKVGGEWHDWMELEKVTRKQLGGQHALSEEAGRRRERKLKGFQKLLQKNAE